jgi:hypothetical protein
MMTLTSADWRKLLAPGVAGLALLAAGVGLIAIAGQAQREARQQLAAAQVERTQNGERLARIAEEEREVREKIEVYQELKRLNILGEERRLEWADALARIRSSRELLDLRYRVERQRTLVSVPGKPANVDFHASTMHVALALLHEEDLLRFLSDLRDSGNAYYAVRRCVLSRTGQPATGSGLVPRLRAECDIDLVTAMDRAARP